MTQARQGESQLIKLFNTVLSFPTCVCDEFWMVRDSERPKSNFIPCRRVFYM